MREMDPEGGFYRKTTGNHGGYTQAICTIALCEAFGRARDERVGLAAQKAVARCEKAVSPDGGWRYSPNSPVSDMSVTAWFIQALKTAKLAQLKFDNAIYSQALAYVDSVTDKGGSKESSGAVTYQPAADQEVGGNGHPALTSAAMMVRQFTHTLGVKNHLLLKVRADPQAGSHLEQQRLLLLVLRHLCHAQHGERVPPVVEQAHPRRAPGEPVPRRRTRRKLGAGGR
jgi:hypothetical protein